MNCTKIAADAIAAVCGQPPLAGTGKLAYIINFEDADKDGSTVTANVISDIALVDGTSGFSFTTIEDSMMGEGSLNLGTYFKTIQHDVTLRIHAKTEANKTFINNIVGSKVIVILPNLETGAAGEIKYEVWGWDAGLEANELTFTTDMADETVYMVKLGSGDKSKEGTLPKSFFITDLATTEAALAALLEIQS